MKSVFIFIFTLLCTIFLCHAVFDKKFVGLEEVMADISSSSIDFDKYAEINDIGRIALDTYFKKFKYDYFTPISEGSNILEWLGIIASWVLDIGRILVDGIIVLCVNIFSILYAMFFIIFEIFGTLSGVIHVLFGVAV